MSWLALPNVVRSLRRLAPVRRLERATSLTRQAALGPARRVVETGCCLPDLRLPVAGSASRVVARFSAAGTSTRGTARSVLLVLQHAAGQLPRPASSRRSQVQRTSCTASRRSVCCDGASYSGSAGAFAFPAAALAASAAAPRCPAADTPGPHAVRGVGSKATIQRLGQLAGRLQGQQAGRLELARCAVLRRRSSQRPGGGKASRPAGSSSRFMRGAAMSQLAARPSKLVPAAVSSELALSSAASRQLQQQQAPQQRQQPSSRAW
jgi:hypothetical protein